MQPIAKKIKHEFELHGTKIHDDYAWLRANGWPSSVTDKAVITYLEEENEYFKNYITPLEDKKQEFFEELKGRIKLDDQSTYTKKDDFYYYTRTEADKNYTIYCRKRGTIDAPEEIILDVNNLAIGKEFTSLGAFSISPDHKLMAYSVDFTGGEKYTIRVYDLENKKFLSDEIPDTIGAVVWHETIAGFFYSPTDEKWRHDKIKFHKLGVPPKEDKIILHEPDPLYYVGASKSSSKQYIFININGHDSNEIYYIAMQDPSFTPKLLNKRMDQILYSVDHNDKYFYKSTNNKAKNFHILRTESSSYTENSKWEIYIAEKKDAYLSGFDITQNYLLLNYKVNGLPETTVQHIEDGTQKILTFPESAYTAGIYSTNYDEDDIRVNYSSLARPTTIYSYDFHTNELTTIKIQEIPTGLNPDDYTVERIFAQTEGVQVPISLFYKKSLFKQDGSNPLYLYGYGSYGIGTPPAFRSSAISLVDRGFVYAIAHIRGGDDLGHDWYEAAKFLTKKRTFSDFISATETLIEKKYTSTGNIVIMGGSAGGLLIGNVINQRPELFKAAIAHVPFVDVLNTMLDGDLPLTPGEYKEWGNPEDKEYFDYIKSYSPYDNVSKQHYPHLFVTAGLSDPRVGYWEAAKWVAKIRDYKLDDNLILYKTNMSFGHMGASGRFDYLKEAAEDLTFIANIFEL
ncbi:MAG: S9 family peptidase [Rickettsiaceae bacterium]|nr:S9 family peptidase [Rickettsiaceae bacterium]MDP4832148.1 S9 family peptidase [Rickettsiaceae bacterium]MDP5020344.1 S9 family peptidase [Rickettsiaceae bacterium]MDP5082836.1 S9 family peptidase [Rickettsiaceae bacterium]